jgi:hypothetical protein
MNILIIFYALTMHYKKWHLKLADLQRKKYMSNSAYKRGDDGASQCYSCNVRECQFVDKIKAQDDHGFLPSSA